ncbi:MAG: 3'-5' exonuclease [Chromatiaceae bacterium]|nr:3'-5' exonuclease [Chromatiaceae bacterium]
MTEEELLAPISVYQASFASTWAGDAPLRSVRFVVLDCESTGLDPKRDSIVSIGAVAVSEAQIILADGFETLLKVSHNTAATLIHGITREETFNALDEREAMQGFLDYLRDGVIVGHHINHDLAMLNAACERHFGVRLRNRHLDTMALTMHLQTDGAFAHNPPIPGFSLDALCERFEVIPYDRHTAAGDAFLTAQVFLRLLRYAERNNRATLDALTEPFHPVED